MSLVDTNIAANLPLPQQSTVGVQFEGGKVPASQVWRIPVSTCSACHHHRRVIPYCYSVRGVRGQYVSAILGGQRVRSR